MNKIIFEYTDRGRNVFNKEGYNIWVQYPDDEEAHFLKFSNVDEAFNIKSLHEELGDTVVFTRKPIKDIQMDGV